MNLEDRIVYESGNFYAYRLERNRIEIRITLPNRCVATVLGIVPSLDRAKRFIDRAAKHPDNFYRCFS